MLCGIAVACCNAAVRETGIAGECPFCALLMEFVFSYFQLGSAAERALEAILRQLWTEARVNSATRLL